MSNGSDSNSALLAMCREAIEGNVTAKGSKTCEAHGRVVHGITVLLHCKVAELHRKRAVGMFMLKEMARAVFYIGLAILGLQKLA